MKLLRGIQLKNLLSFGPEGATLELEDLNLIIGPNASGKSNLIEAISLLRTTPATPSHVDLHAVVRRGGGVSEWIWKGEPQGSGIASIEANIEYLGDIKLRHLLSFRDEQKFSLAGERIFLIPDEGEPEQLDWKIGPIPPPSRSSSILAQLRDPVRYPEFTYLTDAYEKIRIYREWTFGRNTIFREPQKADMRNDHLEEDFSNLGLVLSRLKRTPSAKASIIQGLQDLYDGVTDFDPIVEGGSVQVFLTEGNFTVPATRLSDGTLRYLCLLAILCDPTPPPLICIEEPELGLHPDVLPKLADLLIQASLRTQLIVTTHSDVLVDCMTDRPEAVIVCEKESGQTRMHRLSRAALEGWLDKYRLGQLWTSGEIGGNRW